jgi:NADH dehydrogenase (ubiquinone) Fe-S protein 6
MVKADLSKLAAQKHTETIRYMNPDEKTTHTGQHFAEEAPERVRFLSVTGKQTNERWAIDLVAQDPVVVTDLRTVVSSGGGALGHPKVYINVDKNQVHVCDYSGRRFIKRKFYDPKVHGPSVEYDNYLQQVARLERLELGV